MKTLNGKRCRHKNLMTKPNYPDDIICEDCQAIWTISEYMYMNPKQLMTLPLFIRREVLKRQADEFNKENPDYYTTEAEFENLLDKASQPLEPERKPDSKEAETSESQTSGDCSGSHTHSDSPEGI